MECVTNSKHEGDNGAGADMCVHMATRLSLLWDWHLFPSVVSHEMGT